MAISRINIQSNSSVSALCVDEEEKRIAAKLLEYGILPSGNKTVDKARLREIELKEAKSANYISNKFITVTLAEQEKIQEQKNLKKEENVIDKNIDFKENFNGAKALGEQIFITMKLKKQNNI